MWFPAECYLSLEDGPLALCSGNQKAEVLVREEDPVEDPPSKLLQQQPLYMLDSQLGAPQQETQNSDPGHL
ncbi:hypothetical protein HispidOSU_017469, partial [Sigmodon hispidus]